MLPFVINAVGLSNSSKVSCNDLTVDDPLPSVLELSEDGYVLSLGTRITEVNLETTDDN